MGNLLPQVMVNISQMIDLSKGDPYTPTLTESMAGPYKAGFMQAMTQDIK